MRTTALTHSTGGFSLIELLVVITIFGLLSGIVAVNVLGVSDDARVQITKTQIIEVESAVVQHCLRTGRVPDSLLDIVGEDLLLPAVPTDAWGHEIEYERIDARHFRAWSRGADGIAGGEGLDADIDRAAAHAPRRSEEASAR